MKKTELRQIIKESIKELMTEQQTPNGIYVQLTTCQNATLTDCSPAGNQSHFGVCVSVNGQPPQPGDKLVGHMQGPTFPRDQSGHNAWFNGVQWCSSPTNTMPCTCPVVFKVEDDTQFPPNTPCYVDPSHYSNNYTDQVGAVWSGVVGTNPAAGKNIYVDNLYTGGCNWGNVPVTPIGPQKIPDTKTTNPNLTGFDPGFKGDDLEMSKRFQDLANIERR
tara:strand:+ start:1649 stop:2305 length:657 start_codon:yes stop_codon:yes gene_type:complete